jgi:hypothetical protein
MFNYFYTIEINMTSELAQKEFGPVISSMFHNIANVEMNSRSFSNEKSCIDEMLFEIDKITKLVDKYEIEPLYVESHPNPFLIHQHEIPYEVSDEEKRFWNPNKLALFAVFQKKDDIDFFMRYVIYCYDDTLDLSSVDPLNFVGKETQSKFLN